MTLAALALAGFLLAVPTAAAPKSKSEEDSMKKSAREIRHPMKKLFIASLVVIIVGLAALAGASSALADSKTECVGVLTGTHDNVVVPEGAHCEMTAATVTGNVLVKSGASLRASASQIGGNVHGNDSAWVCLQFGTQAGGNFHVKGGDAGTTTGFDISTSVGGNAHVTENAGLTFIDAAGVGGNVDVRKNTGTLEIEFNTVGGNVKVENNFVPAVYTGGPPQPAPGGCGFPSALLIPINMSVINNVVDGHMEVSRNVGPGTKTVAGNSAERIKCKDNSPPFVGGPNAAATTEGQCF